MKSVAFLIATVALAGGCSHAAIRPDGPPPKGGRVAPPPAWVETSGGRTWLGLSSYCWQDESRGVCVDAAAPKCGMKGVPAVLVASGEEPRIHLGFDPTSAEIHPGKLTKTDDPRELRWTSVVAGPVLIFATAGNGDVSYVACVKHASG